jgi:hypothetical protein
MKRSMTRALLVGAITVLSLAGTALPASAASNGGKAAPGTVTPALGCPASGQRVKPSNSDAVYMIDPQGYWDHIAGPSIYDRLWDSWTGISTVDPGTVSSCIKFGGDFYGYLSQASGDVNVYIWDNTYGTGCYRWIPSADVFNKYGFGWDKIGLVASISNVCAANIGPWNK